MKQGANVPTKEQEKSVKLTTLKHGYHKPYAADWGKATTAAKIKLMTMKEG